MTRTLSPVDIVTASAGTGKTTRLAGEFLQALDGGAMPDGRPAAADGVVATTFTVKAADELMERVRGRLLESGRWAEAQAALAGYLGTVNAVAGRLVGEFAFEAGLSPVSGVIDESREAEIFARAVDAALEETAATIEPVARRLSYVGSGGKRDTPDWRDIVLKIATAARQNLIAPEALPAFAQRSWQGLAPLLDPLRAGETAEQLDRELAVAVQAAVLGLVAGGDTTKATAEALAQLQRVLPALSQGSAIAWVEWAQLSKLKVGAKSRDFAAPVVQAATAHSRHPRLHADVEVLIHGVFACAQAAMNAYQDYKRRQGLMDFTDQECHAYALLKRDDVRAQLAERIDLALIDEFQDTSPIQLALFLELAAIARRSIWVGDQKQAIYGFRGTDPDLIRRAVAEVVPASGGTTDTLGVSYRSRAALVEFANDLFAPAFAAMGMNRAEVAITADRTDEPGQPDALNVWSLGGKNWDDAIAALAEGVVQVLAAPGAWPVGLKGGGTRPLRGGDIAILCLSNERCRAVATALAERGLPVAIARSGLMETDEAALAFAAFRYLVDPGDSLAVAEMLRLRHRPEAPEAWLECWLKDGREAAKALLPEIAALDGARERLMHLTPTEAFELAVAVGGIDRALAAWGNLRQRLANLDRLRGYAQSYQELCRARRSAATAAGLIAYLWDLPEAGDQAANPDERAVQVLTYHKAKGLEWPMVVMLDLQGSDRATAFKVSVEPPDEAFDPWNPLAGRWVRYWPWPYGSQQQGVHLDATADEARETIEARRREQEERLRLLYVGITRARDYLMLAMRKGGTAWIESVHNADGVPVVASPLDAGEVMVGGHAHKTVVTPLAAPAEEEAAVAEAPATWLGPVLAEPLPQHPPFAIAPSGLTALPPGWTAETAPALTLGGRLPLVGDPDMERLGEAVHAFLAADDATAPEAERLALAERQLRAWNVPQLAPASLLDAGQRLHAFLNQHHPDVHWHREWPIAGRLALQRVCGRIDLVGDSPAGWVVIDHKSFPGGPEHWPAKALGYAPQLALYAEVLAQATGRPLAAAYIHMPVVGAMLPINLNPISGEMD